MPPPAGDPVKDTTPETAPGAAPPETSTRRPTVPALDAMIGTALPVLDHGFVQLVDYMGDDQAIVQAARVSYGRGTKRAREDRGLIRYLLRHHHTTPFEMCEIKVHVKLPIFVARQWIRHRTASVNEYSARYSILDREFYVPTPALLAGQSSSNRQGRGDAVSPQRAAHVLDLLKKDAELTYAHYEDMLGGAAETQKTGEETEGIARELARINLPVSFYTQWYWKIDLHNLLRFIALRADPHAQHEIRVYAEALAGLTKLWVPDVYEAFVDYQLEGASLSRMEVEALKRLLRGETPDLAALGLSAREQVEFKQRFDLT
jgi:thymidylate synthase (FAD)